MARSFFFYFVVATAVLICGANGDACLHDSTLEAAIPDAVVALRAPTAPWRDPTAGYLIYCHCMGRFGNQIDHFLGAVAWAKKINRTLVIPPFIQYDGGRTTFRPFTELFDLAPVAVYHRAIDMETFMVEMAPKIWPAAARDVYCYTQSTPVDCRAKDGNPKGTFWNHFGINFRSDIGSPLLYMHSAAEWADLFPPASHPVIATTVSPGPYPVDPANRELQRLLQWAPWRKEMAADFIARRIVKNATDTWVAAHVRAGSDWDSACGHATGHAAYMSSPQCVLPTGKVTRSVCLPSVDEAAKDIIAAIGHVSATALFIGTDNVPFAQKLEDAVIRGLHRKIPIRVVMFKDSDPLLDLALFEAADWFVGNCVSSFTAFAARARAVSRKPSSFFGVPVSTTS